MKKLLLLLITLTSLTNVSYASFPVTEKTQVNIIEIPRRIPMDDNLKILLLSLVPIPAAIIGYILFSAGSIGFVLGIVVAAIAFGSAIYSLYLNFTTNISFWDWKNYLAVITALLLGFLTLGFSVIIITFGGLG
jgi:hypothetical protein